MSRRGLAERLWLARQDCDFSLRTLAQRSHVSVTFISDLENGHQANPSIDTVAKLSKALDVEPSWLAWGGD